MKLYAPKYYKDFQCIADRCSHSCCVGWEIDIDRDTMQKYRELDRAYGAEIRDSVEAGEPPHFRLCDGERCPHLNEKGLCRIILNVGEGYLCDICREHPRFYNNTVRGREVGLGIACEEAARLVLSSADYAEMVEVGDGDGEDVDFECGFDALAKRERIYAILSDKKRSFSDRLSQIYADYGVSPQIMSDDGWRELFSSLEYLDESHKAELAAFSISPRVDQALEPYLERALAYFIYRHCTEAEDVDDFAASLGLCLVLERLLASMAERHGAKTLADLIIPARIISEELEYSEEKTESIRFEFAFR